MVLIKAANLAIRFILELCALTALGYWGFHIRNGLLMKWTVGLGAPLLAAVIWGLFVAPNATVSIPVSLRLILELIVFGSSAFALYAAGKPQLALVFASIYAINRVLLYIWDL